MERFGNTCCTGAIKNNFDQHKITKRKRRQREVIDWMLLKRGIGNGECGIGNGE